MKHEDDEINRTSTFEGNFVTQLRTLVLIASHRKFWNVFLGNKVEFLVEQKPEEATMVMELDFPCYRARKIKKKLVMFQKQGSQPRFGE